jgi:hypothetical protein
MTGGRADLRQHIYIYTHAVTNMNIFKVDIITQSINDWTNMVQFPLRDLQLVLW